MKKALAFIMALTLLFTMAACNGKQNDDSSSDAQTGNNVEIIDGVAQIKKLSGIPIQGTLPQKTETVDDFDASEYYWGDNYWNNILASGDKAFFVYHLLDATGMPVPENTEEERNWWSDTKQALYFTDGETIYLLKEDVYALCGIDDTGLYLLVRDETVKQYDAYYINKQTSLVHFNPTTGESETVVQGVQNAILNGNVLYYSIAVDSQHANSTSEYFTSEYLLQIGTYDIETQETNIVFEDDMYEKYSVPTIDINGDLTTFDNAYDISFQVAGYKGTVYAFLYYPKESDHGYTRVLELEFGNGELLQDSLVDGFEDLPQFMGEQWDGIMHEQLVFTNEAEEIKGTFYLFDEQILYFTSSYLLDKTVSSAEVVQYNILTNGKNYEFFIYNIWTDIDIFEMETYIDIFEWKTQEDGVREVNPVLTITLNGIEGPHPKDYTLTRAGNYLFIQTLSPSYMVLVNMNTNEITVLGTAETQVLLPN